MSSDGFVQRAAPEGQQLAAGHALGIVILAHSGAGHHDDTQAARRQP
jgi:hypothetical protein